MVDREARQRAAEVIRVFRNGKLNNDAFHAEFGLLVRSRDRALRAIESMLWSVSDHSRVHTLEGNDALNREGHALFDRCLLFLQSDLEYEWPQDRFDRTWGCIPHLHVLTLGLTWLYTRWKVRRNERFYAEVRSSGDFDVWPFFRRADLEGVLRREGTGR
jgi:hypothetical protein